MSITTQVRGRTKYLTTAVLAALACAGSASGQCDPTVVDVGPAEWVRGVAVDGGRLAVGFEPDTGAPRVNLYERVGCSWTYTGDLMHGAAGDRFGTAVTISGSRIAVGDTDSQKVFVFRQLSGGNWVTEDVIDYPGSGDSWFGSAVSVEGNTLAVSAHREEWDGQTTGAVYVFRRSGSNWDFEERLRPLAPEALLLWGMVTDIDDGRILVGSRNGADLFEFDGDWDRTEHFEDPNPGIADNFGFAVSLEGSHLAVADPREDLAGTDRGAVYLYRPQGNDWVLDDTLTDPSAQDDDLFGHGLTGDGDRLVAMSPVGNFATAFQFASGDWDHLSHFAGIGADFLLWMDLTNRELAIGALEEGQAFVYELCPDITGDGMVGIPELLLILDSWGSSNPTADVTADGNVDTDDLLAVLHGWGSCD